MATVENPDGMFCITADHDLTDGFWKVPIEPSDSRDLVFGNTRHDVVVFLVAAADYSFFDFVHRKGAAKCRTLICSLPDPLRTIYSSAAAPTPEDRWIRIYGTLNFITDTVYAGATQAAMVRRTGSKGYSYLWGSPNPVSSPQLSGIAGHCTEMIYTTGLYLAR
jgi:hypothetical protein